MTRNIHPVRNGATEYCANCKYADKQSHLIGYYAKNWCEKWQQVVLATDCCNRWEAHND